MLYLIIFRPSFGNKVHKKSGSKQGKKSLNTLSRPSKCFWL